MDYLSVPQTAASIVDLSAVPKDPLTAVRFLSLSVLRTAFVMDSLRADLLLGILSVILKVGVMETSMVCLTECCCCPQLVKQKDSRMGCLKEVLMETLMVYLTDYCCCPQLVKQKDFRMGCLREVLKADQKDVKEPLMAVPIGVGMVLLSE